jgi:8-oxo-dGTP diphosphatase
MVRKIAGAMVIKDGKILLMKRKFEPHKDCWSPPGGFTDKATNESVEDCAVRETKEETGIEIEIVKKVDVFKEYNKDRGRDEEYHLFLCKPTSEEIVVGEEEASDVQWFELKSLGALNLFPGFDKIIEKF